MKKEITVTTKPNGSRAVVLPKYMCDAIELDKKAVASFKEDTIVIKPIKDNKDENMATKV